MRAGGTSPPQPHLGCLLKFAGLRVAHEGGAVALHVPHNLLRDFGVKAAKRNRSDSNRGIVTEGSQKSGSLEGDVRRTNAQGLPRGAGEGEDVIRGDAALLGARGIEVGGAAADGDDELIGSERGLSAVFLCRGDGVGIDEGAISVHVRHVVIAQRSAVAKVEAPDVILDGSHHLAPVVALVFHLPAILLGVREGLAEDASLVHQLLRDASDVDARASFQGLDAHIVVTRVWSPVAKAKLTSSRTFFHIVLGRHVWC